MRILFVLLVFLSACSHTIQSDWVYHSIEHRQIQNQPIYPLSIYRPTWPHSFGYFPWGPGLNSFNWNVYNYGWVPYSYWLNIPIVVKPQREPKKQNNTPRSAPSSYQPRPGVVIREEPRQIQSIQRAPNNSFSAPKQTRTHLTQPRTTRSTTENVKTIEMSKQQRGRIPR